MKRKYMFRIKNAGLFDIEERRMEAYAKNGWIPHSISKRFIILKKAEPVDLRCRLVYYDVADPSYNRFVTETQSMGWTFVSNDGISQSLFTAPTSVELEPISIPEKEQSIIKRHRAVQGIIALLGAFALIVVVMRNLQKDGSIGTNRIFIYASWLALVLQWTVAYVSETRNIKIVGGTAERRDSAFAYILHASLLALIAVTLVFAVFFAVQPL